jgi:hypothetical protein
MSELLHTMVVGVPVADARKMRNKSVPLKLFETEPQRHGDDEESRVFSAMRAQVHTKGEAAAVVLDKDGEEISPHA